MATKEQIKERLINATWKIQNSDSNSGYGMCMIREEINKLFAKRGVNE